MMLPTLASLQQFEERIPGGIPSGDLKRAEAALQDASAHVREAAGKTWITDDELDEVPDIVTTITMAVARRAFLNPDELKSENIDGEQVSFANSQAELTDTERSLVRRAAGSLGIGTISLEGDLPLGPAPSDETYAEFVSDLGL